MNHRWTRIDTDFFAISYGCTIRVYRCASVVACLGHPCDGIFKRLPGIVMAIHTFGEHLDFQNLSLPRPFLLPLPSCLLLPQRLLT